MSISWGVSPIAWINDDMPELGGETTLDEILRDAHAIGFDGIELGTAFPREPAVLAPIMDRYGLRVAAGWYGAELLTRSAEAELAAMQPHLRLLTAMNTDVFVIAEVSNTAHCDRSGRLDASPRVDAMARSLFADRLNRIADYLRSRGFRLAYHHHLGTIIETADDLRRLIAATNDHVGFVVDTGHALLGGIDPVAMVRDHPGRVAHVHCKDIRRDRHAAVSRAGGSFLDGVVDGMFTVPGDGDHDFAPFLRALAEIAYTGWIVVEAEQDPGLAPPREHQELGLTTLKRLATEAGLIDGGCPTRSPTGNGAYVA